MLERYVACTFELNKRTRYKKRMNMQTSWVKTWSKKSTKNVNLQKIESDTNCQFCIIRYEISNVYSTLHHGTQYITIQNIVFTEHIEKICTVGWMTMMNQSFMTILVPFIFIPHWTLVRLEFPFNHINFYLKANRCLQIPFFWCINI